MDYGWVARPVPRLASLPTEEGAAADVRPADTADTADTPAGRSDRLGLGTRERAHERLVAFLVDRLGEELAQLWERDAARGADRTTPGLAAQVAVVDELLTTVQAGALPGRHDLRMLLFGYGRHPDYDPAWVRHVLE